MNDVVHSAFNIRDSVEKVRQRSPNLWVFGRQMTKADMVILLGKVTANVIENSPELISLIVAGGTFCDVVGKRFVYLGIVQLFPGFFQCSRICQSFFPTIYGSPSLTIVSLKPVLVEGLAVCQLQSYSEAFSLVMESFVIIEE